jgi:hypothetical protein
VNYQCLESYGSEELIWLIAVGWFWARSSKRRETITQACMHSNRPE